MAFLEESWMEGWFDPLDFLGISGYLNEFFDPDWDKHIPKFQGHIDLATLHITSFIELSMLSMRIS